MKEGNKMNKLLKKIVLIGFVLIAGTAILTGCGGSGDNGGGETGGEKVIRLGYPGTSNAMFGLGSVAQDQKYFDEELEKAGYKVEYTNFPAAGPAVNEALASGNIDAAIYADFPGIILTSKGVPLKLYGIPESRFYSQILVATDSEIASVKELKGKKIGFTKGTYMQKNLLEILEANGLSKSDVELINVTTDGPSALISGNIDALVTTEQEGLLQVVTQKAAKTLDTTRNYPDIAAQSVFIASEGYATENPEAIIAINKALLRAAELFRTDPDKAYESVTKTGLNLESVKALYDSEAPDFDLFQVGITDESIKKLEVTVDFLKAEELISAPVDVKAWSDNSFYEKAVK